jgi:hypothetical protein
LSLFIFSFALTSSGHVVYVGVVCKWIKRKINLSHVGKKYYFPSVYKCKFLLCSILSESHGEKTLIVGFLMLLYGHL